MKDAEFMKAEQKEKTLRDWYRFIESRFKRKYFTKALYDHLHLHCSFIAHYNIDGFYGTFFLDPSDTKQFLDRFNRQETKRGFDYWIDDSEYADLNVPMCELVESMYDELVNEAEVKEKARDLSRAKILAEKWGWTVQPEG